MNSPFRFIRQRVKSTYPRREIWRRFRRLGLDSLEGRRMLAAGSLDMSFGAGGIVTTEFYSNTASSEEAFTTAIQADGKILAAGTDGIMRFNVDGTLDTGFGRFGKQFFSGQAHSLALQSDGKIVVVGYDSNGSSLDFALARYNSDGTFDKTFGSDGRLITAIGTAYDDARSVALQGDGKIVVAGFSSIESQYDFALARYNSDGSLDTSFHTDGKLTTPIGASNDRVYGVALQSDGKIVVAGQSHNGLSYDFALARYNSDGSLDTSFDSDGKLTTAFQSGADEAYCIAIQSDGKIVVAGTSYFNSNPYDFALARYNSDGSLDKSFGSNGKLTTDFGTTNDYAQSMVLQDDGKIVVAGRSRNGLNSDFAVARYNSNGSLDTSFDFDGKLTTAIGAAIDVAYSVALQLDGKIVVAGQGNIGSNYDFALARYNSDGSLDTSFDFDGLLTAAFGLSNDYARGIVLQSDGKIVAAGSSFNGLNNDFALSRYNVDGSLDTSFDVDGKLITPFGVSHDSVESVALQSDGKIIVAGTSSNGSNLDFALARYNTDGSLDMSFDSDGKVITAFGAGDDRVYSVELWSDGKIVVAGSSSNGSDTDFALARYHSDGTLDTTFGVDGKLTTSFGVSDDSAKDVVLQNDGKIVVAGVSGSFPSYAFTLARYDSAGSLDSSFGSDGTLTTAFGNSSNVAYSVAIQSDGKIVAAGYSNNGLNNDFALARYNSDGSLDGSFDTDGILTTPFGTGNDHVFGISIQSDGKIIAVGTSNNGKNNDFAVARYNNDGSFDGSFGVDGKLTTAVGFANDSAESAVLQSDGKIVVVGNFQNGSNDDFAVIRYQGASNTAPINLALS